MLRKPEQFQQEGSKVFRKAPVNVASIDGWVRISGGKAADAARKANSASTRLGAAYDAVFNLSLAVLCKNGWRCTAADGHHAQALEAALQGVEGRYGRRTADVVAMQLEYPGREAARSGDAQPSIGMMKTRS